MAREEIHAGVWWKRADEEELKHWQHQCFLVASLISCKGVHFPSRKMVAASETQIGSDSSGENPAVPLPRLCSAPLVHNTRTCLDSLTCPWFPELPGFSLIVTFVFIWFVCLIFKQWICCVLKNTISWSLEAFTDTAVIVIITHRTKEKLFCYSFNSVYILFHCCVYF